MNLKTNSFIVTLVLLPFIFLLAILRCINFLKQSFYDYIILGLLFVFFISFIISLFYALDEILHSNKKSRFVLMLFFPFLYLPIYYSKYVSISEKYLSYSLLGLDIILSILFFFSFKTMFINYMTMDLMSNFALKTIYNYADKSNTFTIDVDKNYVCGNNLEGYTLSCENNKDDSFIGIYLYEKESFSEGELDDIKSFHLEDILSIINENNYEYVVNNMDDLVKIDYNDMTVLIKQNNYINENKSYCLVIIKEVLDYEENINDFNRMIDTIRFLR